MAIPKYDEITLPMLQYFSDDKPHLINDLIDHISAHFKLSEEEKNQLKPSGGQTLFRNRIGWSKFYLKKAGLISVSPDKMHQITQDGLDLLKKNPEKIDRKLLQQIPKYAEFINSMKDENSEETLLITDQNTSPEDLIISGYTEYRKNLESEILEKIKNKHPDFFEYLVIDLIENMGYGRGTVTGKSGDGGIDGMVDEDKLGLSQIYLQAKRWQGTVPGREIRDFAGVLDSKKSKKGIFITTSDFSQDAKEFVKTTSSKIILINGKRLSQLMFDHNVGFSKGDTYQLKTIDEDYFAQNNF